MTLLIVRDEISFDRASIALEKIQRWWERGVWIFLAGIIPFFFETPLFSSHSWELPSLAFPVLIGFCIIAAYRECYPEALESILKFRLRLLSPDSWGLKIGLLVLLTAVLSFEILGKFKKLEWGFIPVILVVVLFSVRSVYRNIMTQLRTAAERSKFRIQYEDEFLNDHTHVLMASLAPPIILAVLAAVTGNLLVFILAVLFYGILKPTRELLVEPCPRCFAERLRCISPFPGCRQCFRDKIVATTEDQSAF